jgi:hypothetical protein
VLRQDEQPTAPKIAGESFVSDKKRRSVSVSCSSVFADLHAWHNCLTKRWFRTQRKASAMRLGLMPKSTRREIVDKASTVCETVLSFLAIAVWR